MKKKIILFINVVLVFILTGCLSQEEKSKREIYYNQAKINAINYIEKKYGFTPEYISAKCSDPGKFGIDCNETIFVHMKHDQKEFDVLIDGDKETNQAQDNYQNDEIVEDLTKEIINETGITPFNSSIEKRLKNYNVINTYYDKTNLSEILEKHYFEILFEYVDEKEFKNNIIPNKLKRLDEYGKLVFVNYNSLDSYNDAKSHGTWVEEDHLKENAMYIDNAILITNGEIKEYNFPIIKFDGLYFYFGEYNNITLSKTKLDDLSNWTHNKFKKQVSDAYSINSIKDFYIYIPVNKYKKYKPGDLYIGTQCIKKDGTSLYNGGLSLHYSKISDYYVAKIFITSDCVDDVRFAILKE